MSTAARRVTTPEADTETIGRIFDAQRRHALALRESTAQQRIAKLKKLRRVIYERWDDIREACHADFAKPAAEVDVSEILPVVAEANHAIRHLKRWMAAERKRPTMLMFGTSAWVRNEPKGVSLIISPWNYPINLSFGPLVSAIAAGNTVMLKPSEMTPHCAGLMDELIGELFEAKEIAVVQGAVETSQALLALPFDHIFFTGSPAVGKIVMGAAAQHLSSVTLELGGKSPVIVDQTADLASAAQKIAWGKFANNGQTCIAPDYLYVHADILDAFVAALRQAIETMYGAPSGIESNPDYCRIVNDKHYSRIRALLDDATERGARIPAGSTPVNDDNYIAPTLLTDVDANARIMSEEIFGPLLPILTYTDIAQPIAHINGQPKPLALYLFSRDHATSDRVIRQTSAGGTCVNQAMLQFLHGQLPFGGVNNSGIGNSHGHYGFKAFSHERAILRDRFSLSFLFLPPYNRVTRWLIRLAVKFLN